MVLRVLQTLTAMGLLLLWASGFLSVKWSHISQSLMIAIIQNSQLWDWCLAKTLGLLSGLPGTNVPPTVYFHSQPSKRKVGSHYSSAWNSSVSPHLVPNCLGTHSLLVCLLSSTPSPLFPQLPLLLPSLYPPAILIPFNHLQAQQAYFCLWSFALAVASIGKIEEESGGR